MGLLEQYQQQYPEAFRPRDHEQEAGGDEYGFIVRLVIHLPGGVVRNARQANRFLLITACIFLLLTVVVYLWNKGASPQAFTPSGYTAPIPSGSSNGQ
jgi:hypothetical protein